MSFSDWSAGDQFVLWFADGTVRGTSLKRKSVLLGRFFILYLGATFGNWEPGQRFKNEILKMLCFYFNPVVIKRVGFKEISHCDKRYLWRVTAASPLLLIEICFYKMDKNIYRSSFSALVSHHKPVKHTCRLHVFDHWLNQSQHSVPPVDWCVNRSFGFVVGWNRRRVEDWVVWCFHLTFQNARKAAHVLDWYGHHIVVLLCTICWTSVGIACCVVNILCYDMFPLENALLWDFTCA